MTQTQTIALDNGIVVTTTVTVDPDGYTSVDQAVTGMDVEVGQALSHVGGRPKTRPKKKP